MKALFIQDYGPVVTAPDTRIFSGDGLGKWQEHFNRLSRDNQNAIKTSLIKQSNPQYIQDGNLDKYFSEGLQNGKITITAMMEELWLHSNPSNTEPVQPTTIYRKKDTGEMKAINVDSTEA